MIVIGAFALGFLSNEYRHSGTGATPIFRTLSATQQESENQLADKSPVSLSQPIPSPAPAATDSTAATEIATFSWNRIEQLLARGRFEEVIALLQGHLAQTPGSSRAWVLLAQSYEQIDNHEAALEAWFNYLDIEVDALKLEQAIAYVRTYLMRLHQKPSLVSDNTNWLISHFNELLEFNANDAELHVVLASMYAKLEDNYQAQYHAMMAANDPALQAQAENILAALNGTALPDELSVPLVRFGNQYLVNVTLEGYPARLLLDTGASLSGVSNVYTAKYPSLVKSTKPIRLNTASGTVDSLLFTVDTLRIDDLAFNQHILALLPMHNLTEFDGLLGVDILGRFDFVIDQDASVLRLRARKN